MTDQPLVGILMGSQSDADVMDAAAKELESRGIPYEMKVHLRPPRPRSRARVLAQRRIPGSEGDHRRRGQSRRAPRRGRLDDRPAGDRGAHPHRGPGGPRLAPLDGADAARRSGGDRGHQRRPQRRHPRRQDPPGGRASPAPVGAKGGAQAVAEAATSTAATSAAVAPDDPALLHARDGRRLDRRGPHGCLAAGGDGGLRGLDPAGPDPGGRDGRDTRRRRPSTSTGSTRSRRPPSTTSSRSSVAWPRTWATPPSTSITA